MKAYDGTDEVCGDVLLVDVRCFGPPVSEPIAFLTLVAAPRSESPALEGVLLPVRGCAVIRRGCL